MIVLITNKEKCQLAIIEKIHDEGSTNKLPTISLVFLNGNKLLIKKIEDLFTLHLLSSPVAKNTRLLDPDSIKSIINSFNFNEQIKEYSQFIKNKNIDFFELAKSHHELILQIFNSKCFNCNSFLSHYQTSKAAHTLRKLIKENEQNIQDEKIQLIPLKQCYLNLLESMNFINNQKNQYIINLKGRVAMVVGGDSILSTELLFNAFFDDCSPEEIAALASCLVWERRSTQNEEDVILPNLEDKINQMKEFADYIISMMNENAVPFDENEYASMMFNPMASKAIFLWASQWHQIKTTFYGTKFLPILTASRGVSTPPTLRFGSAPAALDAR